MDYIAEINKLKALIETYPAGYISRKVINGKIRYYHQWTEKGKIKSRYIKDSELESFVKLIDEKHVLKERLKRYQELFRDGVTTKESEVELFWLPDFKKKYKDKVYEKLEEFKCDRVPSLEKFLHEDCWRAVTPYIVYDNLRQMVIGYFSLVTSSIIVPVEDELYDEADDKKYVNDIIPSLEIEHFAVNDRYLDLIRSEGGNAHNIGKWIFNTFITECIKEIRQKVNFSYVSLHAFNHEKVINAYREMGFMTFEDDRNEIIPMLEEAKALYNDYTEGCMFMFKDYASFEEALY